MTNNSKINLLGILVLCLLAACNAPEKRHGGRLKILATTGMIGDAVKNIAGDSADVEVLMGPGVDPHLYKPTPKDVDLLSEADIIVYNGVHLEGKMVSILEKVGKIKKTIVVSEGISPARFIVGNPEEVKKGAHPAYDPHIWFDVDLWKTGIEYMGKELARADTAHTAYYLKNLNGYLSRLDRLHTWTKDHIGSIPPTQRVMITAHDAFNYFGKAYDIEVRGLQGISTVAEPGLKDITGLVKLITSRHIKAVFIESSISEKNIEAVIQGAQSRGQDVRIGGTLYSDAMGPAGTPEGTYEGMVKHNVETIVKGLK